ncbi:MAG: NYN domain-containing protein [Boseongicola sp.]
MPDRDRPLYAVLIDADNVPSIFAGSILMEVTSFAEPALRKVYGDWASGNLEKWRGEVRSHGLVAYQETANKKGKNASDIGMVIDAMDILHAGRLDGFVIVSSDSDFTRLASRIREQGLAVIGMGEKKSHKSFVNACQRFIYLENLLANGPAKSQAATSPTKLNPTKAVPLIRRAMKKIDPDSEWYALGQLGQHLLADNPDFDCRSYGMAKLSDLFLGLKEFELKKFNGQLLVRRTT